MNRMREEIENSALGPVELSEETGQRSFRFDDEFIGFAGHFPEYPILPAVLQILMAQTVAEQLSGNRLQFLALERAKFTHQLRPGDQIEVSAHCRKKQEQLSFSCELQVDKKRAASFTLLLSKESNE